jgi:hypothetical protein
VGEGEIRRLMPGRLVTTFHEAALTTQQASAIQNCSTSRGIWELDQRYRRLPTKPGTNNVTNVCTAGGNPGGASTITRASATKLFTNPTNVQALDAVYATSPGLLPGDATDLIKASSLDAGGVVPDDGYNLQAHIKVRLHTTINTGFETPVVDDYVKLTLDGAEVGGNLATFVALPAADATRDYMIPLAPLGITPAMVRANRIGALVGYSARPTAADAFRPDYWTVTVVPGPQSLSGNSPQTLNTPYTMTATYIGPGSSPTYVVLQVTTHALTPNVSHGSPYTGNATVTDGFGGTSAGPIAFPVTPGGTPTRLIDTTGSVRLNVVANVGTGTITPTGTATLTTGNPVTIGTSAVAVMGAPTAAVILVDSIQLVVCYDHAATVPPAGPQGIGYGTFGGADRISVVLGQGAYNIDAVNVPAPGTSAWSAELSGLSLDVGPWFIWQYGKWLFYTSKTGGVYYRTIQDVDTSVPPDTSYGKWIPVYKNPTSPGSTGSAQITTVRPPYDQQQVFIAGTDTIAATTNIPAAITPIINGVSNLAQITVADNGPGYAVYYIEFEVTLATARSWSKEQALGYEMRQTLADGTGYGNDGFDDRPANNKIILTNGAGTTWENDVIHCYGTLNQPNGTYFAWVDLTGCPDAVRSNVKKIKIRFGLYQTGGSLYRLQQLITSGIYYHDGVTPFYTQNASTVAEMDYAYDYTEGLTVRHAQKVVVTPLTHLGGAKPANFDGSFPYFGSRQSVRVPTGNAPYSPAATINLYRLVGANWQRIATGTNANDLVYEDALPDSVIAADPGTYPITVMNFDVTPPSASGVATGVNCGCAWKGSNCYGGNDGKLYFSRANQPTTVLWDNVVLTNDVGSIDLGPARTSVVADNTADPILALVPAENLYVFTKRECYVFISGQTAATASFPRKIDGVRGCLGLRAACLYGDRALVAATDGLWIVKKQSDIGFEPDLLVEVTKENRVFWKQFIASNPSGVVVRQHLGQIWCFNGNNYFHIRIDMNPISGSWADGRQVVDAVSDPFYGMLLLMNDGSVGVIGDYVTDGGILLAGTDGVPPVWSYTGHRLDEGLQIRRGVIWAETSAVSMAVDLLVESEQGSAHIDLTGLPPGSISLPFDVLPMGGRLGGATSKLTISGGAQDRVRTVEVEIVKRDVTRGQI